MQWQLPMALNNAPQANQLTTTDTVGAAVVRFVANGASWADIEDAMITTPFPSQEFIKEFVPVV